MQYKKQFLATLAGIISMVKLSYAQADNQLSNLVAPTKVNVALLPAGSGTKDLGSATRKWRNGYFNGTVYGYGAKSIYGVYGRDTSANGYGVYGVDSAVGGIGVYGKGAKYGIYGVSDSAYGVVGTGVYTGVYGASTDEYGDGVYGSGFSGVRCEGSTYGVNAYGALAGVYGYSITYGVLGSSGYYAGYFQGNVYTTGTYQSSDKALKKNIREFNSGLDLINKLKPREYEFRNDGNYEKMNLPKGEHYGLIAQDVEEVLPNLIKETKFEPEMARSDTARMDASGKRLPPAARIESKTETINFKALNYTEFIPILIKAVQELDEKNNALQEDNTALRNELADLKKQVNQNNKQAFAVSGSSASLAQNSPNPFSKSTVISFTIPKESRVANIVVTETSTGKVLRTIPVSGSSQITLDAASLATGTYTYTLYVDGNKIDSKRLILNK